MSTEIMAWLPQELFQPIIYAAVEQKIEDALALRLVNSKLVLGVTLAVLFPVQRED